MRKIPLEGLIFGGWLVLDFSYKDKSGNRYWNCRCLHCGLEKTVHSGQLKNNHGGCNACVRKTERTGTNAKYAILLRYKNNARYSGPNKGINREFSLTEEQFFALTQKRCHYCGIEPSQIMKKQYDSFIYNGIDRKDNTKGYTIENCEPCCKECNLRKGTLSYEQFLDWIERITKAHTMRASAGGTK